MSWLFHENALEGVVLSEGEILQALEQQGVADASLLTTVTIIRNHRMALDRVRVAVDDKRFRVSVGFIVELYEMLSRGIVLPGKDKSGLRKEIPLHRTYFHDILHPDRIPDELQKLVD